MFKKILFFIFLILFFTASLTGCFSSAPKINSLKLLNKLLVQTDLIILPETILINLKKAELVLKNNIKTIKEYQHKASFGKASEERKQTISMIFDNSANLTELIKYNENSGIDVKNVLKYDDKGNIIERICYNADGSMKFKEDIEYKYDNSSNVTEAKIKNSSDNSSMILSFVYNDKGYLIERTLYSKDGSIDSKQTYIYADNGSLVNVTEYAPNGSIMAKVEYIYNENFFITEIKRTISSSTDKWLYSYDNSGNVSEENAEIKNKTSITKFKYDDKRLILQTDFCNIAKEPEIITKYEYEFF
ncbi:MAG: hypothetical protein QMC67_12540 [Candidatus Wallbacteria bacterium]